MDSLKAISDRILLDPKYADVLALVKGARNGAVYGAKIRFPHALVMVFLFRSGTVRQKLYMIWKATRTHARNLATFAFIYKATMLTLHQSPLPPTSRKERSSDTFLAGLIAGYLVFGRGYQSSVNQQIIIYVFSRSILALARLSVQNRNIIPMAVEEKVTTNAWPVFAALSWATVMWLFRWHPETLQPSLQSSMQYMYVECTKRQRNEDDSPTAWLC
ncbi:MAG: hypothetical protein MMC33_007960 [Icmadophila ericetorum]|nr:hypothetical protein [Icmadophila ericetorum]